MSDLLVSNIRKARHFRLGPLRRGRLKRTPYVIGFDTEAENGRPFMIQFSLPDESEEQAHLFRVKPRKHEALRVFMDVIHNVCTSRHREYLVFGFNLTYEFTQLFGDVPPWLALESDWELVYHWNEIPNDPITDYLIKVANNKRHFLRIRNTRTHVTISVYDAASFFPTSLDKAAKAIGIEGKTEKRTVFTRRAARSKTFQEYARRDAFITRRLGEQIVAWHEQYDVRTCISAPHFAASVFRRRYLTDVIPTAKPEELEQYGLYAYHGGKNGYYRDRPMEISDVYNLDIRSAYPEAMRQLPNIESASWDRIEGYEPNSHAVYRVKGEYDPCLFRGLQTIGGSWRVPAGPVETYITGYELDEIIRRGEFRIIECDGYAMHGESGGPLTDYVNEFYEQKRTANDPTIRLLAKLFLNSLYGKFFQKVPIDHEVEWEIGMDESGHSVIRNLYPDEWRAGGLYHPPIAALITGYVRAKIHRLEHSYDSIMTSTDGLFAMSPPPDAAVGNDLGMLDVARGSLRIWRERLYVFTSEHGQVKDARHGFRSSVSVLNTIPLEPGVYEYDGQQVVTLALATKMLNGRMYRPGEFARLPFVLDLRNAS